MTRLFRGILFVLLVFGFWAPIALPLNPKDIYSFPSGFTDQPTGEVRELKHDRPLIPNKRTKDNHHESPYIHIPTFRSLL